jgi:hypothetical protein
MIWMWGLPKASEAILCEPPAQRIADYGGHIGCGTVSKEITMNDADIMRLAGTWELRPEVAHDQELRKIALHLAVQFANGGKSSPMLSVVQDAKNFYNFLKGEDVEQNLHNQK